MTKAQKAKFARLVIAMEPENLYWDGERSHAEAKAAYRAIEREWRALEREVGHPVTEGEAWRWLMNEEVAL